MRYVSNCCGCSYEDSTITDCCHVEMNKYDRRINIDTDSVVQFCNACNNIAECSGYICNECGNWFEELEEDYEYKARTKENYDEMMRDGEKDER
jgi:hypothetical protein